jgi:pyruvate dehydrogenase E1 component
MAQEIPAGGHVEVDAGELSEWSDSVDDLVRAHNRRDATRVVATAWARARALGLEVPGALHTDYVNTIPPEAEPSFPGDEAIETRIRHYVRWNAAVMVARANRRADGLGGHLSTYASAATLYEVGFNHFFRGTESRAGDQVFFQGHASPGIYARAYLEGRLSEGDLDGFRREVGGGLPSYPHPRRSDFWQFPTVSMGLGPLMAAHQARFNRYLAARSLVDTDSSRVWCFVGDGEMDEPESAAAVAMAGREALSNLVFVVNCNLQRLDGPVRGNAKIIQELEGVFRGAGWNVIKVVWAREWDPLLAADAGGVLIDKMNATLDGEFQKFRVETGGYIRDHFFGPDPRLQALVAHLSDSDLRRLRRGGHDPAKVYAAYRAAVEHTDGPTVVLAKTVKGWALGPDFEARNATHQIKKMTEAELKTFRDRLELPIPDAELADDLPPYAHPGFDSEEYRYLAERRRILGGPLPARRTGHVSLDLPGDEAYRDLQSGTGPKVTASTTGAFTRLLRTLLRDPSLGPRIVPIVPDEARTFGIDGLFRQVGIYQPGGQRYEPVDASLLLSYTEAANGQILEEGITEAGAMASTMAAGTSYATFGEPTVPSSSTIRCSAFTGRLISSGPSVTPEVAGSFWRPRPVAQPFKVRVSSTAMVTASSMRRRCRRAGLSTRRSPTKWPSSYVPDSRRCTAPIPKMSSTTSRFTTRPTRCPSCPPESKTASSRDFTATPAAPTAPPIAPVSWPAVRPCSLRSPRNDC